MYKRIDTFCCGACSFGELAPAVCQHPKVSRLLPALVEMDVCSSVSTLESNSHPSCVHDQMSLDSASQPTREAATTLFLDAVLTLSFQSCIHMCLRIPASFGSRRRQSRPARPSRRPSATVCAMAARRSPSFEADWSVSPSPPRRKSKSRARSKEPDWLENTAKRLETGASAAEEAAASGGADLKAMYVMSSAQIIAASASSQPHMSAISDSMEYKMASSSQPRPHVEASYVLDRLTSGGFKKPLLHSGPFATALNPNRHTMMIQGRPVVVLCGRKHTRMSFQPYAFFWLHLGGR